jgi:hypothetical protein
VVSTVNVEVALRLVADGQAVPLVASFGYATSDPYAVRVAFHVGLDEPVEWIFARSLLADGAKAPEGHGDVLVWPSGDGQVISISLASPFGEALFEAPAADIAGFLAITYRLVPAGSEPGHVDIDAELTSLLAEGGPW